MQHHFIYKSSSAAQGAKRALKKMEIQSEIIRTPESKWKKGCSRTLRTSDSKITGDFLASLGFPPDGEY